MNNESKFSNLKLHKNIQILPISESAKNQIPCFIKLFSGPDTLQCLVLAAKSYLKMYEIGGFKGLENTTPKYESLSRELVSKNEEILKVAPKISYNQEVTIKKQTYGVFLKNPIYTLMVFSYPHEKEKFNRLRLALYLANLGRLDGSLSLLDHDNYAFSLLVRKLTDTDVGQKWLAEIKLSELDDFDSLRAAILKLKESLPDKHTLEIQIEKCNNFLNATCGLPVIRRERATRKPGEVDCIATKKSWGYNSINELEELETIVEGDPVESDIYPRVSAIKKKPVEDKIVKFIEFGMEPEEVPAIDEHYVFVFDENLSAAGRAFQVSIKQAQILNAIEKENQNLEYRYQRLNDQNIHDLFMLIKKEVEVGNGLIGMAVFTMFSLSVPPERVKGLKLIRTSQRVDLIEIPNKIYYDLDTLSWLLTPFDYCYKTKDIDGSAEQSLQVNKEFVELPDMFEFYKLVQCECGDDPSEDIFSNIENIDLKMKRLIKKVGNGVTPSKVKNQILRMAASKIDPAAATLMTGSKLHTSSATKYYTVRSLNEIHHDYQKCTAYYSMLLNYSPVNLVRSDSLQGYVGARYTPDINHVKNVMFGLKNKLEYKRIQKGSKWWVEFHNLYTVYCIYSQIFLTGLRAVNKPFLSIDKFIFDSEIAVFRDKDGEDEFHTRNIPCHKMVKMISKYYKKHFEIIKERLRKEGANISDDENIFLIDSDLKIVEARPKNIAVFLNEFTVLPLNSNRKFLRNYLFRQGVSNTSINTFLGHGSRGEKYSERYLTRDLYSIREEINPVIDNMIKDIDLTLVKGLLR